VIGKPAKEKKSMNTSLIAKAKQELVFAGINASLFEKELFDIKIDKDNIASLIDHTILKPDSTVDAVKKVCKEARDNGFATVCVNSCFIPLAAAALKGSSVRPISVVGFPLGAMETSSKAFETKKAVENGAGEIDMVMNVGFLKSKLYKDVLSDIEAVVKAAAPNFVKVIIETSLLATEEKIAACLLAKAGGAAYVKTSTGFGGGGATVEDITLMRAVVGPGLGVKASGGVKSKEDAMKMIKAGATRIGTSSGVAIMAGGSSTAKY
jgi:deoxyribose-phosphate aldolase